MKQTRQVVCAVTQSIFLDVYDLDGPVSVYPFQPSLMFPGKAKTPAE